MIDFRPFRNDDPPAICKIWRSHPPTRGIYGEITPTLLESVVLSRPFFDRDGLIIATENDRPLGFAHAGFAVNTDGSGLDLHRGTTCMLMVEGLSQRMDVAGQLVQQCEGYLRRRGAQQLYAGATPLLAPFYVGLYGGAVAPGLLASDATVLDVFQRAGYVPSAHAAFCNGRWLVFDRRLIDNRSSSNEPCGSSSSRILRPTHGGKHAQRG